MEGVVGLSVFAPADLFNTANMIADQMGEDGPRFDVHIVSIDGGPVQTSSGHEILTEKLPSTDRPFDIVIVPGIGAKSFDQLDESLRAHNQIPDLLAALENKGTIIAAACTGTFFLGMSGLLDGGRATTTWWMADRFREAFPEIELLDDAMLVDEGQIITSAAGASSLDLSLHLIHRLAGANLARLSARYLIVDGGRKSQNLYSIPWHSKSRDPMIEKADRWIRKQRGVRLKVGDLAAYLGVTDRSLLRKFRALTGMTPQAFIQGVRLDLSKPDLEDTQNSVARIAADAGFSDENAFRKAFALRNGITPSQYRRQFRPD